MKKNKQKTFHISFDENNEDLYFEIMRESTRNLVPVAALGRYYMRLGMETGKKPTLVWGNTMKNLPPVSTVEYEMLQAIAKAQRKQPKQVISDFIKQTYLAL